MTQNSNRQKTEFQKYVNTLSKEALLLAKYAPKIFCNFYHQIKKHAGKKKYKTLEETANEALQKTQSKKANIICHSQGGLLGLLYAVENPEKVSNYATFGTPFKGTPAAYLSPILLIVGIMPSSTRQLMPDSKFTQELRQQFQQKNGELEKCGLQLQNMRALYDEFVPYDSSALKELVPNAQNITEITQQESHLTILHSKKSLEIIECILNKEEPTIFVPGYALNYGLFENITKKMKYDKEKTHFLHYDYTKPIKFI